jgi:lipopolysaccharide transport system permease protein
MSASISATAAREAVWSLAPRQAWQMLRQHRQLLRQLAWREVQSRYRGSWLGVLWSLLNPLVMLTLYTFVFSVVFQARWNVQAEEGKLDFALSLFAGLIVFNLFAETITAAPALVLANTNYVKRVVFPLEVLPLARLLSGMVQAVFSLVILILANLLCRGYVSWTLVFLPLVLLPTLLMTLGLAYFLASLGVFVRDIGNVVGPGTTALMFLSPVMYPLSRLPESVRPVLAYNPLAPAVDGFRRVTIECQVPDWTSWIVVTLFGLLLVWAGWTWFAKSKNAFADVL